MSGLPPGFHFFPSDEDLVVHFLYPKASSLFPGKDDVIPSLDLHDPWELDGRALQGGSNWYFFTQRSGTRVTASGYWEAEAEADDDVIVRSGNEEVGVKRTLVFFVGKAPNGIRSSWVMYEYHRLESVGNNGGGGGGGSSSSSSSRRNSKRSSNKKTHIETEGWVICQVFDTSCNSQERCYDDDDGTELSCLDEAFLTSLDDDLDEIGWPN